jgi:hypothetical protein
MTQKDDGQAVTTTALHAMAALKRAADEARKIAIQTNTAIVVFQDGKRVHITAEELRTRERIAGPL